MLNRKSNFIHNHRLKISKIDRKVSKCVCYSLTIYTYYFNGKTKLKHVYVVTHKFKQNQFLIYKLINKIKLISLIENLIYSCNKRYSYESIQTQLKNVQSGK